MKQRQKKHHPLLKRQAILAALTIVVLIELSSILGALVLPRLDLQLGAVITSVVTDLTNQSRTNNKLPALKVNPVLTEAAQARAEDMAAKGYFSHTSPDGKLPWIWFDQAGYKYEYAGENLAVNFSDSDELVSAWMNSPAHRQNILGPHFTEIGVGMASGKYQGRDAVFVVQFFASPAGQVLGVSTKAATSPSLWNRIASSSKSYATYSFLVLATLFIALLLIGWGKHHPKALAQGVLFVGLLAGLMYVNKAFIYPTLTLPIETQAAAVQALK